MTAGTDAPGVRSYIDTPCTTAGGTYSIVQGLEMDAFSQERVGITLKELEDSLLARLANAQVGNTYTTQRMRSAAHFSAPRHVPLAMPTVFLHCPVCPG